MSYHFRARSFEEYKAEFQGLCTDSMAFDLWVIEELRFEPDSEELKERIRAAKESIHYEYA